MKILITGGAGFIGSHLIESYLEKGYEVAIVDKEIKPTINHLKNKIKIFNCDITKPEIEKVFEDFKPNIISHHAALIHINNSLKEPTKYGKTNVLATIKLLELSKQHKIKQFLFKLLISTQNP